MLSQVSVIVPVGPGERAWVGLLEGLARLPGATEILFCGTEPKAPRELLAFGRARWVSSPAGRAVQQNTGARAARGRFVWFLHADSVLSPDALPALERALAKAPSALHYFDLRFLEDGPALMKINEAGCWLRSRVLGIPYGDQGFCIERSRFLELGGFPEDAPYGEDHLFLWKARYAGIEPRSVGATLRTSARKYRERGWASLTARYASILAEQAIPEGVKLVKKRVLG